MDVMLIRYFHPLTNIPKKCACGTNNSLDHALICKKCGYVAMRHNQIRDFILNFLTESGCKDIVREPHLLPLTVEYPNVTPCYKVKMDFLNPKFNQICLEIAYFWLLFGL